MGRTAHRPTGFQCPNQFSRFVQRLKGQMGACFPPTKFKSSQMSLCRDSLSSQTNGNGRPLWLGAKIGWKEARRERIILEIPAAS